MEILLIPIFIVLSLIVVLGHTIPIYKKHAETSANIKNFDSYMREFVYKVNLPSEIIINALSSRNDVDELYCHFDSENSVIRISEYGSHRDYYYQIIECDGYCILKLEQVALIGMRSYIPYRLNPFMVSKLQAELIPYSEYK